jgi:hypothetical protein
VRSQELQGHVSALLHGQLAAQLAAEKAAATAAARSQQQQHQQRLLEAAGGAEGDWGSGAEEAMM